MTHRDLPLDGNAISGAMRDVFSFEISTARATCRGCRSEGAVGALPTYVNAPGVVVRCPHCDHVLMRLVHGEGRYWLDLSGTVSLTFLEE